MEEEMSLLIKKIYRLKGYRSKNYRKSIKSMLIMMNTE